MVQKFTKQAGQYFVVIVCFFLIEGCSRKLENLSSRENLSPIIMYNIVLPNNSSRTTNLAANELAHYLEILFNAEVQITNSNLDDADHIFKIRRASANEINIIGEDDLKAGAFRISTMGNITEFSGFDDDYIPIEPYPFDRSAIESDQLEFRRLSRNFWRNPFQTLFKSYNPILNIWEQDGRGTLNAVYHYLGLCGIRWYHPGNDGEFIEALDSLPFVNTIEKPIYRVRNLQLYTKRFFACNEDDLLWQLRLKLNPGYYVLGSSQLGHGLTNIHGTQENKDRYPEMYFGNNDGTRDFNTRDDGQPCLSSPELFNQTVDYCKLIFDHYKEDCVSVMPPDAYSKACNCNLCANKFATNSSTTNLLSNYVWTYVNNIAQRLKVSHPTKKIICFAYGAYLEPPTSINQLSDNVIVGLTRAKIDKVDDANLIMAWKNKTPNKLIFWDYYLYNSLDNVDSKRLKYYGSEVSSDLLLNQNNTFGEYIEVFNTPDNKDLLNNHFNIYLTSKLYWSSDISRLTTIEDEYFKHLYPTKFIEAKQLYKKIDQLNTLTTVSDVNEINAIINLAKSTDNSLLAQRLLLNETKHYDKMIGHVIRSKRPNTDVQNLKAIERSSTGFNFNGSYRSNQFWANNFEYYFGEENSKTYFKTSWSENKFLVGFRLGFISKPTSKIILDLETEYGLNYVFQLFPNGQIEIRDGGNNLLNITNVSYKNINSNDVWEGEIVLPIEYSDDLLIRKTKIVGMKPSKNTPWFININYTDTNTFYDYFGTNDSSEKNYVRMIVP